MLPSGLKSIHISPPVLGIDIEFVTVSVELSMIVTDDPLKFVTYRFDPSGEIVNPNGPFVGIVDNNSKELVSITEIEFDPKFAT